MPGSAPNFNGWGNPPLTAGQWGAGFRANAFVDPKDVSFRGVVFGEGSVAAVVTPAGSYLSPLHGFMHAVNTFGPAHGGNATTGTAVSPPQDGIWTGARPPARKIPWEFSVAGGPRTRFAGGFTANHRFISTLFCNAIIEKAGAGPVCRRINGTTC